MKANSASKPNGFCAALIFSLWMASGVMSIGPASAGLTDISNIPLANASANMALPNIYFMLDDSGSMAWPTLPGALSEFDTIPRIDNYWASAQCNGMAYDPNVTYSKPPSLGSVTYSNAMFSAAKDDGYVTGSTTTNLGNSVYYVYTGSQTPLSFTYDTSGNVITTTTFYQECNSDPNYPYTATITIGGGGGKRYSVTSVTVNGVQLLTGGATSSSSNISTVASRIAQNISVSGYTVSSSGSIVTIAASSSSVSGYTPVVTTTNSGVGSSMTFTNTSFVGNAGAGKFTKVTLTAASSEAQNYANWYSYYRTRILMVKTALGLAFQNVRGTPLSYSVDPNDGNYFHARVGFDSISRNSGKSPVSLASFDSAQRTLFYDTLYSQVANNATPLRTALELVGEMYKTTGTGAPIQYSCQRNYAILSTDGYWNGAAPTSPANGNQDGSEPRPMYDGSTMTGTATDVYQRYQYSTTTSGCTGSQLALVTQEQRDTITTQTINGVQQTPTDSGWGNYGSAVFGSCQASVTVPSSNPSSATLYSHSDPVVTASGGSSDSLSDVAMYYYKTDLRPDLVNNVPAVGNTVLDDSATWQHMTTYTIGLGVSGTLNFDPNYKTSTSGAFYNILNGSSNWPVPQHDSPTAVDDLWHAAVDGHGTYFSAKNAKLLASSMKQAFSEISAATGGGSASASSSLNPTTGSDYSYVPSYITGDWTGDLTAYAITSSGAASVTATWSAASQLKTRLATKSYTDRTIYTSLPGSSSLVNFVPGIFTTSEQMGWFANSQLVQSSDEWTAAQTTNGTLTNLVNYLRGDSTYERGSATVNNRLYRIRKGPLGDIVHSQPVYVGKPSFNYLDTAGTGGYAKFKADNASRTGMIYVGANDGMLHAFNVSDGSEAWAYVPPMVLPNLWNLADRDYSGSHHWFVDGPIAVYDAYINGAWATVLIGAVGGGGRGYFALNVTTPTSPTLLWTFTADSDPNMGYSFGAPVVVKVNGRWVAVLTSGYNNVPESGGTKYSTADGKGHVYVLDLASGSVLRDISTGVGSSGTPSGLATLNVQITGSGDYTAKAAYGGDLTGNMYRFDLAAGTESTLIALGSTKPITTAPEIATVSGNTVVFFGSGEYLGKSDMTTTAAQGIYAVKDANGNTASTSNLVSQSLSGGVISTTSVDWGTKDGWYVSLSGGERVNIAPQLQLGIVAFATTIPPSSASDPCTAGGGTGWIYQFSILNGGSINGNSTIGTHLDYLPVGLALIGAGGLGGTSGADGKVIVRTGQGTESILDIMKASGSAATGTATRVLWRQLLK